MKVKFFGSAVVAACLFSPTSLHSCSRSTPVSNVEMIQRADVIVRAVAENYVVPPEKSNYFSTSMPESTIRFKVLEVILGEIPDESVVLHGTLVDRDDSTTIVLPIPSFAREAEAVIVLRFLIA